MDPGNHRSHLAVIPLSLVITALSSGLASTSHAVCSSPITNLCAQGAPETYCQSNLCVDLISSMVSVGYDSGAMNYPYSLQACNTDDFLCAESNQTTQIKITLKSAKGCIDLEKYIHIKTADDPIDVNSCLTSSTIADLAGTLDPDAGCLPENRDGYCSGTIEMDLNNTFCEDSESNNLHVIAPLNSGEVPDLRFVGPASDDVGCEESAACDDMNSGTRDVRMRFQVVNHSCGTANVGSAVVRGLVFNASSCSNDPIVPDPPMTSSPMDPGEVVDYDLCLHPPSSCDHKCCQAIIDYNEDGNGVVAENNESNNKANDNTIESSLVVGIPFQTIDATIINSSNATATFDTEVNTTLPFNWTHLSVAPASQSLDAGEEGTVTLTYSADPGAQGARVEVISTNMTGNWTQDNQFLVGLNLPTWGLAVLGTALLFSGALYRRRSKH